MYSLIEALMARNNEMRVIAQRFDTRCFPEPEEILLQLTHRDVFLDFFKGKKELILTLRSGQPLRVEGTYMTAAVDKRTVRVLKFSRAFAARLEALTGKGYEVCGAAVHLIAAWKAEGDEEETAVVLPDIQLKKRPV